MSPATATRHPGLDRLKVGLTLLVVLHHAAITYGGPGSWFWKERSADGRITDVALAVFAAVNQSFFMGLFFLMAGAFTAAALSRRDRMSFLRERTWRLGVPLLLFGWGLGPLTVALAQLPRGRPFGETLAALWSRGAFVEGPLWFASALFVFCAIAMLRGPRPVIARAFPSDARLLAAALVCGAVSFAVRLDWPVGRTVFGWQLAYFPGYVLLFAAGVVAVERRWWLAVPPDTARHWRRVTWLALPTLALLQVLPGPLEGGWNPAALLYAFWEPFVAWGIVMSLLVRAQRHTATPGPLEAALARRAFAVYVIHPPVLVAVTLVLRPFDGPAIVKALLAGGLAAAACVLLAGVLLRVPGVARVL